MDSEDQAQLDDIWAGFWPGSGTQSLGGTLSGQVVVLPRSAPAPLIFPVLTWLTEPLLSVDPEGECEAEAREKLLFSACCCPAAGAGALVGDLDCQG